MSNTAGETPQMEEPEDDDPRWRIAEPTETHHGLVVIDHDGTVFVETVDSEGEVHQSIMVGAMDFEEVQRLSNALTEVTDRHE